MEDKINNPSQIKSAKTETILSQFQSVGLNNYILEYSKDIILSILLAEGKVARLSKRGKDFMNNIEKERLEIRAKTLAPLYLKKLSELGFPEKEISMETHKKEIKELLDKN